MIVKRYAQISEETARRAKQAYSFFDYVEGSATASYRSEVDKCYEIACRAAEKRPKEEERAEQLKKLKAKAEQPAEEKYPHVDGVAVEENAEAMRIQLFFDGKPSEEVRAVLKSNGFRWSPSFGAWQRQLTDNGKWATRKALEEIARIEE